MGFGLNIAQPATSGISEALSQAFHSPVTTQVESGNFNFGEIIKPYIQGSPENGGYDVQIPGRLAMNPGFSLADYNRGMFPAEKNVVQRNPLIFIGLGLGAGLLFLLFKR
jgi:hypothetical protein